MAGTLFLKEVPIYTLSTSNAAALSNTVATTVVGQNLDCRSSSALSPEHAVAMFQFKCSFNATSGISVGTDICDLYLLPALDGSTFPTIGTSQISPNQYVATFTNPATSVAVSTIVSYVSPIVDLFPTLYQAAIINQSGQTINSSWVLQVVTAQGNYT